MMHYYGGSCYDDRQDKLRLRKSSSILGTNSTYQFRPCYYLGDYSNNDRGASPHDVLSTPRHSNEFVPTPTTLHATLRSNSSPANNATHTRPRKSSSPVSVAAFAVLNEPPDGANNCYPTHVEGHQATHQHVDFNFEPPFLHRLSYHESFSFEDQRPVAGHGGSHASSCFNSDDYRALNYDPRGTSALDFRPSQHGNSEGYECFPTSTTSTNGFQFETFQHDPQLQTPQKSTTPKYCPQTSSIIAPTTATPTPQNLRDNPERLAKVKTELCAYFEKGKPCPWGDKCNYAHGEHELKFKYSTLLLMEHSGQIVNAHTHLARPCMTWVSTGDCPFGRRCCSIHDPLVKGPDELPSWLPAASAKTSSLVIVDRLSLHRENAIHQENPLIAQTIWEGCRPSIRNKCYGNGAPGNKVLSIEEEEYIKWMDTYLLVCNAGASSFLGASEMKHRRSCESSSEVSELQKLCIARLMRSGDGEFQQDPSGSDDEMQNSNGEVTQKLKSQLHRDFVFSPTHSVHSELCMIFQVRYFQLLEVDYSRGGVSMNDIVEEISAEEYTARTTPWSTMDYPFSPRTVVAAHEVAFAPKGDSSANVSIWFNANAIKLEQGQIKRSRRIKQKIKSQMKAGHNRPNANGALISRTTTKDFTTSRHLQPPGIDPFVPMLPAEDNEENYNLIDSVIEHRIDSIICSYLPPSATKQLREEDIYYRMGNLQKAFCALNCFHERWTWPKREGMENVNMMTRAPRQNLMNYNPSKVHPTSAYSQNVWSSFVKSMDTSYSPAHSHMDYESKRLKVFRSFDYRGATRDKLPRISLDDNERSSKNHRTWKEILLGTSDDCGNKWETALQVHYKKKNCSLEHDNSIMAMNMPVSTIHFAQSYESK